MTISKVSILILVLSFFSCQNNYKENNFESSELLEDTKLLQLLFFKKEQKVELWSTNSVNKLPSSNPISMFVATKLQLEFFI